MGRPRKTKDTPKLIDLPQDPAGPITLSTPQTVRGDAVVLLCETVTALRRMVASGDINSSLVSSLVDLMRALGIDYRTLDHFTGLGDSQAIESLQDRTGASASHLVNTSYGKHPQGSEADRDAMRTPFQVPDADRVIPGLQSRLDPNQH